MSEDFEIDAVRVPKAEDQAANASRIIEAADLILESLVSRMEKHLPPCVPPYARSKYLTALGRSMMPSACSSIPPWQSLASPRATSRVLPSSSCVSCAPRW